MGGGVLLEDWSVASEGFPVPFCASVKTLNDDSCVFLARALIN